MAKANFIESAKKPIYKRGKRIEYVSKRGKRAGQKVSHLDRHMPADENDEILINAGEGYWTWCFYGGEPIYSKTQPRQSQLTNNPFKRELYTIQESVEDFSPEDPDEVGVFVEELISNLEELRDTCQESLDNIPEQLQEGNAGQILQERIENLDDVISNLESIDTEFSSELDESEKDDMNQEEWERQEEEEKQQWIADKIGEINDAGLDFE